MSKKGNKRVSNNINPKPSIRVDDKDIIQNEVYKKWNISFDLSFAGCFYSIDESYFNNCLKDESDFVNQYKKCMTMFNKLSGKTLYTIFSSGDFRHCHVLKKRKDVEKAYKIIKKLYEKVGLSDNYFEQNIGSESIYQIGYEDSVRVFGTIRGNIFRILFIDYFHHFDYEQHKNDRNIKNYKFCPMSQQ